MAFFRLPDGSIAFNALIPVPPPDAKRAALILPRNARLTYVATFSIALAALSIGFVGMSIVMCRTLTDASSGLLNSPFFAGSVLILIAPGVGTVAMTLLTGRASYIDARIATVDRLLSRLFYANLIVESLGMMCMAVAVRDSDDSVSNLILFFFATLFAGVFVWAASKVWSLVRR